MLKYPSEENTLPGNVLVKRSRSPGVVFLLPFCLDNFELKFLLSAPTKKIMSESVAALQS